jgi:excisionase family DNA binding protein
MFEDYKDILTPTDLQAALGIGRNTVYQLLKDEKIKHIRIGRSIKIPKFYLVDFIQSSWYYRSSLQSSAVEEVKKNDG